MARKDKYGYRETFPRFYKADYELQQKIGIGSLDPVAFSKAQEYLDSVQVDIIPQLRDILIEIETVLAEAAKVTYEREEFLPKITKPIMDIKSNAGMFHEMMVCRVSSFMLTFLEDVRKFDKDILEIIGAYIKVIKMLLDLKIKDEKNTLGQSFLAEIRNATKRYYDKYDQAVKG